MEFFKKLKPEESEKFNIKEEKDSKILGTLRDQIDIGGGLTDISLSNFNGELDQIIEDRKTIGKEEKVVAEKSWEEKERDEQLEDKIEALKFKYERLREEIKERQIIINELRQTKYGAEKSAKNLNWKEMVSKERNAVATDMMRTAEDRIERLKSKIEKNEIELIPLYQELGEIEETMNSLSDLIRQEIPDEEKTVGNQKYDFNQN